MATAGVEQLVGSDAFKISHHTFYASCVIFPRIKTGHVFASSSSVDTLGPRVKEVIVPVHDVSATWIFGCNCGLFQLLDRALSFLCSINAKVSQADHQPHFAPLPRPTTTIVPLLLLLLLLLLPLLPLLPPSLPSLPSLSPGRCAATGRLRRCCCELRSWCSALHSLLLSVACVIHSRYFSCFSSLPPRCTAVCF